jgi:GT2 family glycosyltransferase
MSEPINNTETGRQRLNGWRVDGVADQALADCSLVVPTYRRGALVAGLLAHLVELPDVPGEVVVVDGSPEAGDGEMVAQWAVAHQPLPFTLRYVRSPAGLTRQRNVGVEASTQRWVFFLDDDCLPQPGYFRAIREALANDDKLGAVCGTIINEMNQPVPIRWRWRFRLGLVPRGEPGRYYPMATSVPRCLVAPFRGLRPVDLVPGGATAYRREVFTRHRFSEFFAGYSQGEDMEMSLRLGRDWRLAWCGEAHVIHNHAGGGRPTSFAKGKMEVRNRYFIWKRHSANARPGDRLRFWGDIAYIGLYDLASFLGRPRQTWHLAHALGVWAGAASCWLTPPRYSEPPLRQRHEFAWRPLAGTSQRPAALLSTVA